VVVTWIALTGGLHHDGLADTCDGLLSWRPRERRLEILRDSRIGSMGVLGLMAVLSLQVAALAALDEAWWRAALVAPVWGRWAAAWGLTCHAPAREDGAFRSFRDAVRRGDAALATASTLLLVAAVWWPWGIAAGAIAVPLVMGLGRGMVRSLGGLTGDTLGALCEAGITAALLALVVATRRLGAI
jgi:adenosylcobinamide-GDP ribazoletransferase